ncbi:MntP/YtaF family protein [Marinicrinis sediminis]|uniref:MntP/YtaF family protein n=1 Tax=Marinicrinis sediminis TaxID=1652465 RepID=A0ABW5R9L9_9BACL
MATWISIGILALAVSLDGFSAGMMYGLRKIRIPVLSVIIICLFSGLVIYLSMLAGTWLLQWISPAAAKAFGGVILIGIGCYAIAQLFWQREDAQWPDGSADSAGRDQSERNSGMNEESGKKLERGGSPVVTTSSVTPLSPLPLLHIEIKKLGIVIDILKTPSAADIDRSGRISASEAAWLGVALSLDALGAGIGAALIGLTPWVTSLCIAVASGMFVSLGLRLGSWCAGWAWMKKMSLLPGCILILLGIMKLL